MGEQSPFGIERSIMAVLIFRIALLAAVVSSCIVPSMSMSDERRLAKHLIEHYDNVGGRFERPPYSNSDTLTHVSFGMAAVSVVDFDEESHVITLRAWLRYRWTDKLLQWYPEDFGGVSEVRIDSDLLWKPDIKLFNNYDVDMEIANEVLAIVHWDGTVLYMPPANLRVECACDDHTEEICRFKFGSWSYDGFKIGLEFYDGLPSIDTSDFILTNDYQVDFPLARKNVKYYPCCPEPYPDLTFTVTLRHSK